MARRNQRSNQTQRVCCSRPRAAAGPGPTPPPCDPPAVDDVLINDLSVCGTAVNPTGPQIMDILFDEAVSGIDEGPGASCNVRLFLCPLNTPAPSPCDPAGPGCPELVPTSVTVTSPTSVQVSFVIPPAILPDFFDPQVYVGGVPACPIVNAAQCPLEPAFCCNIRFSDAG